MKLFGMTKVRLDIILDVLAKLSYGDDHRVYLAAICMTAVFRVFYRFQWMTLRLLPVFVSRDRSHRGTQRFVLVAMCCTAVYSGLRQLRRQTPRSSAVLWRCRGLLNQKRFQIYIPRLKAVSLQFFFRGLSLRKSVLTHQFCDPKLHSREFERSINQISFRKGFANLLDERYFSLIITEILTLLDDHFRDHLN